MKVVLVGPKSKIAQEFRALVMKFSDLQPHVRIVEAGRTAQAVDWADFKDWRETLWLFCCGRLDPKRFDEMNPAEVWGHVEDNLLTVMRGCEQAFKYDPDARVCIVGSTSAWRGSHNMLYAALKAGVHGYVRGRKLLVGQQLVAIAPGIISDAGMTTRRPDVERLFMREVEHPRARFCTAAEVAETALGLLTGSLHVNNTVVDMGGGER